MNSPMVGQQMISPQQCQAARALLGWSQADLATRAEVSRATISRFEKGDSLDLADAIAIRRVMESAAVEFLKKGDGESSIRLAPRACSPGYADGRKTN